MIIKEKILGDGRVGHDWKCVRLTLDVKALSCNFEYELRKQDGTFLGVKKVFKLPVTLQQLEGSILDLADTLVLARANTIVREAVEHQDAIEHADAIPAVLDENGNVVTPEVPEVFGKPEILARDALYGDADLKDGVIA